MAYSTKTYTYANANTKTMFAYTATSMGTLGLSNYPSIKPHITPVPFKIVILGDNNKTRYFYGSGHGFARGSGHGHDSRDRKKNDRSTGLGTSLVVEIDKGVYKTYYVNKTEDIHKAIL